MEIASILLGLTLFILVGLFVGKPFLTDPAPRRQRSARQQLLARKETLIDDLRTLEFDHDTKKIPDDVYEYQRAALIKETAVVLQELDGVTSSRPVDVDTDIEAAIARAKSGKTAVSPPITNSKKSFCSQCGNALDGNDKFCTKCGHKQ